MGDGHHLGVIDVAHADNSEHKSGDGSSLDSEVSVELLVVCTCERDASLQADGQVCECCAYLYASVVHRPTYINTHARARSLLSSIHTHVGVQGHPSPWRY